MPQAVLIFKHVIAPDSTAQVICFNLAPYIIVDGQVLNGFPTKERRDILKKLESNPGLLVPLPPLGNGSSGK